MVNKIKRVSIFFKFFFQLLFVIFPLFLMMAWMTSPGSFVILGGLINMSFIPPAYASNILHALTPLERLFGFGISAVPLTITLFILYSLIKLFNLYAKGEIFSLLNVRYIRNIGYALLLNQLLNPVYEFLMGIVLTMHNPPGHRFATITLDQTNFGMVFAAGMVILISWIMAEGCKLREEQQLTI